MLITLARALVVLAIASSAAAYGQCVKTLALCPDSPNCVATNDANPERRFPLLTIKQSDVAAWKHVRDAISQFERVEIVEEQAGYLHATVTSLIFRFVDDLEVTLCDNGRSLALRSASRTGHWDVGVNRERVEELVDRLRASDTVR
jgi:uncharacterized protein (DUF1499 family)